MSITSYSMPLGRAVALFFTKTGDPAAWVASANKLKEVAPLHVAMLSDQERLANLRGSTAADRQTSK